jgi:hypothetical protein
MSGRYSTERLPVAKFTDALTTPGSCRVMLSALLAQDAQVIPSTGKVFLMVVMPELLLVAIIRLLNYNTNLRIISLTGLVELRN